MDNKQMNQVSVRKRRYITALCFLLSVAIPVVFFVYAFNIQNITVLGAVKYTPEEIGKKIIKTKSESNSLILYLKYKYLPNVQIPFVEDIDVELVDNHSVNIRVHEKSILGCVEFLGEYMYFDKDGIVVESTAERLKDEVLIKGLQYSEIILYKKLKIKKEGLFDVLLNLTQLIDKYGLDVDTITFDSKYEITMECKNNTVLLGKQDTYDEAVSELKNMLAEPWANNLRIDLRKDRGNYFAKPKN